MSVFKFHIFLQPWDFPILVEKLLWSFPMILSMVQAGIGYIDTAELCNNNLK